MEALSTCQYFKGYSNNTRVFDANIIHLFGSPLNGHNIWYSTRDDVYTLLKSLFEQSQPFYEVGKQINLLPVFVK